MKTVFCNKCHKPIRTPNMKLGGKLKTKCPDGHEVEIDFGKLSG
jgi:phage FluMu protein Com